MARLLAFRAPKRRGILQTPYSMVFTAAANKRPFASSSTQAEPGKAAADMPTEDLELEKLRTLNCPYTPGRMLRLTFTPEGGEGATLSIIVSVIRAFIPFTVGQALLVKLSETYHTTAETGRALSPLVRLPSRFLLKLYDRRFVGNRDFPWTQAREEIIRPMLNEVAGGRRSCPPLVALGENGKDEHGVPYSRYHSDFEEWHEDVYFAHFMPHAYEQEVSAYRRLTDLQGLSIPALYGTVYIRITLPQQYDWPSIWDLDLDGVCGLALEYIEGTSAEHIRRSIDVTDHEADAIGQAALQIGRDIVARGVAHLDIAARNVIIRARDCRPFLIDFGTAKLQRHGQTTEDWKNYLKESGINEVGAMRCALSENGLHIPSPVPISKEGHPLTGWARKNRYIEQLPLPSEERATFQSNWMVQITKFGWMRKENPISSNIYVGDSELGNAQ